MPKVDPSAKVHPNAQLADDVVVGPFAVIDENVRIGAGTVIGSHSVVTSPDRKDIRQQSYYENLFHQSTSAIADVEFVNSTVKPHEKLYLFIDKDIIEYALFGVNKTRDLVPVVSLQRLPDGALVLVDKRRIPSITSGFTLLA